MGIPSPLITAANGTGVAVGGTGVMDGSGVNKGVSELFPTAGVLAETGLLLLHADNKIGERQIPIKTTSSRRNLIG